MRQSCRSAEHRLQGACRMRSVDVVKCKWPTVCIHHWFLPEEKGLSEESLDLRGGHSRCHFDATFRNALSRPKGTSLNLFFRCCGSNPIMCCTILWSVLAVELLHGKFLETFDFDEEWILTPVLKSWTCNFVWCSFRRQAERRDSWATYTRHVT